MSIHKVNLEDSLEGSPSRRMLQEVIKIRERTKLLGDIDNADKDIEVRFQKEDEKVFSVEKHVDKYLMEKIVCFLKIHHLYYIES